MIQSARIFWWYQIKQRIYSHQFITFLLQLIDQVRQQMIKLIITPCVSANVHQQYKTIQPCRRFFFIFNYRVENIFTAGIPVPHVRIGIIGRAICTGRIINQLKFVLRSPFNNRIIVPFVRR